MVKSSLITLSIFLVASTPASTQETKPCPCDCPAAATPAKQVPVQLATAGKVIGRVVVENNPLPGATITLETGNDHITQISDVDGRFEFFNVPPGRNYRVHADLVGLKARQKKHVSVLAGGTIEVQFRMSIDQSQAICVDCGSLQPAPLDGPGFVITREMMDNLPIR